MNNEENDRHSQKDVNQAADDVKNEKSAYPRDQKQNGERKKQEFHIVLRKQWPLGRKFVRAPIELS